MEKHSSKKRCRRTRRFIPPKQLGGFTLLEIMVALAVLSISLVVLLGLRNRDIALSERARHITEATFLGRKKMTEVSISGFPDFGETSGTFEEDDLSQYMWRKEVTQTPFEEVREVLLQIVWKNKKSEESVQFTTYLFDDGSNRGGNDASL